MKHLENYKNSLIKVIPSKITTFWFTLYINGSNEGEYRSKEQAIEVGRETIDIVINQLKTIEQDTVIDQVWKDYLEQNKYNPTLDNLLLLTGYEDYDEVCTMYEGLTIEELLKNYVDNKLDENKLFKQRFKELFFDQIDKIEIEENNSGIGNVKCIKRFHNSEGYYLAHYTSYDKYEGLTKSSGTHFYLSQKNIISIIKSDLNIKQNEIKKLAKNILEKEYKLHNVTVYSSDTFVKNY